MTIDTNTIVSVSEANQNFSRVTRIADANGQAVIFKNNRPKYLLVDMESTPYDSLRYMFDDTSDEDGVILTNLSSLGASFRRDWKRILAADAFFMNTDRHMRNFGVIRSSKTGDILRLAPNFDNNQAYTANPMGYSSSMLRLFIRSADAEDRENLQILADGCKGNRYLSQACQAYADLS